MDENGARFTALLENHFHLNKALTEDQRQAELKSQDFIWALHSQSQDLLLERCVRLCEKRFVWEDAKSLGIFLWLQKIDVVVSFSCAVGWYQCTDVLLLFSLERSNGQYCQKYLFIKDGKS